jgi:predicted AAA+ superfamily ATPase
MDNNLIFRRKAYDRLLKWKKERNGATAMLVQGARRIGKSTLVREFAKNEYKSYLLIDFSVAPAEVHDLFKDISNLNYIFFRLQFLYEVTLYERESVIIFDEVQKQPLARQAIKHLVADGRYDYIETGSLISVHKSTVDILIPSEETKIDMFPMDFEEFRWAMGDSATIPLLRTAFENRMPLGNAVHRKLMRDFRLYMLVGGMPQAVAEYIKSNNLASVDAVKREILSLYAEDMSKIDPDGKALAIFDNIPGQLSNNVSRYVVRQSIDGTRADRVSYIIKALEDSMTVNIAYHSNDPNAGLALTRNTDKYKMYLADTGLFITLAFKDKEYTENDIYSRLLNDKLSANLGYVYENMIAQMLRATGKQLYYNTIPANDGKKYYETDFVIADGYKVSPIEVKSSGYKSHTSLDVFCKTYSSRIQNRYLIYTKDLRRDEQTLLIPTCMTMHL